MFKINKKLFLTKNRYLLSLVLGALSALAMPPYCAFPILFFSFPTLLYLFKTSINNKTAFLSGFLFGMGYFTFGLYWISNAIANDFPYLLPLALLGIPALLSIYIGAVGYITKFISNKTSNDFILMLSFAVTYFIFEFLRGILLSGFPWNLTAYTWENYLSIFQNINFLGVYGFSFLSILIFSTPYLFFNKSKFKLAVLINAISVITIVFLFIIGDKKIENDELVYKPFNKNILFIQPSLSLEISNLDSMKTFDEYYLMTKEAITKEDSIDAIVWGETAIPFAINNYPEYLSLLSDIIPEGVVLMTGSIREEEGKYYNSIVVINSDGEIIADYDKSHLVPFGEYMPFDKYIDIEKIVGFNFMFSKGSGVKTVKVEGIPSFSPLVCYEMIFPNKVINKSSKPEFLFNVSNDTFYGISSGPYQHFGIAKAQAIATGLPVVRVGNYGISAIINKNGKIIDSLNLSDKGYKVIAF